MYDVQAYPKSVSNPQKHTQIQVTKRIYNVDDNGNVIPLETKEDVTYNVGLYLDPDGNAPYGEMQKIHIQNASSGTATWTDVPIMYLSWMRMERLFSRIRRSRWMMRIFTTTM